MPIHITCPCCPLARVNTQVSHYPVRTSKKKTFAPDDPSLSDDQKHNLILLAEYARQGGLKLDATWPFETEAYSGEVYHDRRATYVVRFHTKMPVGDTACPGRAAAVA